MVTSKGHEAHETHSSESCATNETHCSESCATIENHLRVLIADDDSAIRALLSHHISAAGHEVVVVSNGTQAIETLKQNTDIQVAMLDWNMPGGIEGVELCRQVSRLPHPVYVIVVTAEDRSLVTAEALNAGAHDYIMKPWIKNVLLARVGVAGRLISMRRQLEATTRELECRITQQQSLQTQLLHAQKMESIGQLAAGIAHEINTPIQYVGDNTRFVRDTINEVLALLDDFCALLPSVRDGQVTPGKIEALESAIDKLDFDFIKAELPQALEQTLGGVSRVAEIVRAMKEFSHPGSAEKIQTDLNKSIESTIAVCRNRWKYVAELQTDFEQNLPATPCLVGEFNQVILNLIVNAADAISEVVGDRGETMGRITIRTRRAGEFVEIRVIDTGGGIPEAHRRRIFDPFFTTKEVGKGTGQGLAISHDVIVNKHGGTIDFTSETGVGTTFTVCLPIAAEPADAQKESVGPASGGAVVSPVETSLPSKEAA